MALLGGIPMKSLATVTAILTVATGMPRVQCVCPDGQVKLFCTGNPASGCCCSPATPSSNSDEATPCCCAAAGRTISCCDHASPSTPSTPADGNASVNACGCQKTVVTDVATVAIEDVAGDGSRLQAAASVAWAAPSVNTEHTAGYARLEPRNSLPPPDLVVLFCHFTC